MFKSKPKPVAWSAQFCGCGSPCTCNVLLHVAAHVSPSDRLQKWLMKDRAVRQFIPWVYSCTYRKKLRANFGGLPPEPCNDCCVHFCCEACALCQEYEELKNRGLDPSQGWTGTHKSAPMPPSMRK
ncbi:hypothetical protein H6P81_019626 [Aristolochia fimbriata]|uniref:Uncharacterized protein n=1 Tax=Aristolochia fimbriata TaxID=158543 RepID=A0AAV7DTD9_ARIFI|nr:hypothetical protein H6P81_019626 [Aristolochia fimbriata]